MQLYRFSPIKSESELLEAIKHVHIECYKLCFNSMRKYLPNAWNIWIFCHYDDEYTILTEIRKNLTYPTNNPDQKYFELHNPIHLTEENWIPEATYTHLYIRKPDPYRSHVWDVDFYLEQEEYNKLKQFLLDGNKIPWARVFERPDLDMIELYNPDSDVLGYISTEKMTQDVRVKINIS